jgi:GxxExxY protein
MDLIKEHNKRYRFFADITGEAMKVYNKFRPGLMESAYEAALKHLLKKGNHKVEQQVWLPMYWDDEKLDQDYRMDLVVDNVILELKAVQYVNSEHRKQLWSYMNLTHTEYGMLLNFGNRQGLLSEWYKRYDDGNIEKIRLF